MIAARALSNHSTGASPLDCCMCVCGFSFWLTGIYMINKGVSDNNGPLIYTGSALMTLPFIIVACAISCHYVFKSCYPSSGYTEIPA